MKIKCFNKIGDTCYRIKNQINGYISFAQWFIETNENKRNMESFKIWAQENKVYKYNKIKLPYYNMILKIALEKYKVIKKIDDKYMKNFNDISAIDDILNNLTQINDLMGKKSIETCVAFKAMLDFMYNYPYLNNAKKIFYAFSVYEKNDDFLELYNRNNIPKDIVENCFNKFSPIEILRKNLLVRKPSIELKKICLDIVKNHKNFCLKQDSYKKIKRNYLSNFSKNDFENFVRNNDLKMIVSQLLVNRYRNLLEKEYFSLFNYTMWGFGLSQSTGKNIETYSNNNIQCNKGFYSIKKINGKQSYPYTLETVNDYLISIQNDKYDFCNTDRHLFGLRKSIIAEYFVNLKFCYLFNIKFNTIQNYINTLLDCEKYPINCAPGKKSDMNYSNDKKIWGIETTIHNTTKKIINYECLPCIEHLEQFKPKKEQTILFLIQPIGYNEKINNWFSSNGKRTFKPNIFIFKTYNFKEVAELKELS